MTLLLIVGGWLLAAFAAASLFGALARAGRGDEPDHPEVVLPQQRAATTAVPSLESQR